jgi:hypothetical protein
MKDATILADIVTSGLLELHHQTRKFNSGKLLSMILIIKLGLFWNSSESVPSRYFDSQLSFGGQGQDKDKHFLQ